MQIDIGRATTADAVGIADVLERAFRTLRSRYTPGAYAATVVSPPAVEQRIAEGPVWIASSAGRIIGTASLLVEGAESYVRGMAVDPDARGRGVARSLLDTVEAYAVEAATARLWLYTTPFLATAIRLYRNAGYVVVTDGESDLHGTPLIAMEKWLG